MEGQLVQKTTLTLLQDSIAKNNYGNYGGRVHRARMLPSVEGLPTYEAPGISLMGIGRFEPQAVTISF
jgi:hypothetical protein